MSDIKRILTRRKRWKSGGWPPLPDPIPPPPDLPPAPSRQRHMTVNGVDIAFCDGESGDGEPVSITIDACPEPLPSDERFATAEAAAMRQSRAPLRTVLPVGDWEVVATYEFVDVVARKRDA